MINDLILIHHNIYTFGRGFSFGEKTRVIGKWVSRVLCKIVHYKAELVFESPRLLEGLGLHPICPSMLMHDNDG